MEPTRVAVNTLGGHGGAAGMLKNLSNRAQAPADLFEPLKNNVNFDKMELVGLET